MWRLSKLVQIKEIVFINLQVRHFRRLRRKGKINYVLPRSVLQELMEFQKSSRPVSSRTLPVKSQIERELVPRRGSPGRFRLKVSSTITHPLVCPWCHSQQTYLLIFGPWRWFLAVLWGRTRAPSSTWGLTRWMRTEPGWEGSPRKRAHSLALVTVFSTGDCARSLNDTTSSHHPTPAAAYMLVENPPGEGMKEAISRSQSWEVETQRIGSLTDDTPQPGAGWGSFHTPSRAPERALRTWTCTWVGTVKLPSDKIAGDTGVAGWAPHLEQRGCRIHWLES